MERAIRGDCLRQYRVAANVDSQRLSWSFTFPMVLRRTAGGNDEVGAVTLPYEIRPGEVITIYCVPFQLKESMQKQGYPRNTHIIPRVSSGHGDAAGKAIRLD